jgi:cytochrome c oxidase assembly factor CtaG
MPAAMLHLSHAAAESRELEFSLTLILVFTAAVYMRGWWHLRADRAKFFPAWRAASFCVGLFLTWIAAASPIASFDGRMLTAHMVQHLLLMTFAPPLIWLGAPVMPFLNGLPPTRLVSRWPLASKIGKLLGHPVFCWLAAAAALVVWHVPALLGLGMKSPIWHLTEHLTFFASGLLFWWPVIRPLPSVSRWSPWSMLLYLFLATLPCDVLSGFLVFSDRIVYPMYLDMPQMAGLSVLEDQACAGALMWTCVTVVFLIAGTVLSMQLLSPQTSSQAAEV